MNDGVFWALIGVVFGGSGLAVVNKLLNRGKDKFDLAAAIRNELRTDIKRYQDEVAGYKKETHDLRVEVEDWKKKYYDLLENQGKLEGQNHDLQDEVRSYQGEVTQLKQVLKEHGINGY